MATFDAAWAEANAYAPSDTIFIDTLEITNALLSPPIRVCNSFEQLATGEGTFLPFYFELDLPQIEPGSVPQLIIKIGNINKDLREGLRKIKQATGATQVRYRRYRMTDTATTPILDEEMAIPLPVSSISIPPAAAAITITCEPLNIVNLPLHKNLYTTARFPGLKA